MGLDEVQGCRWVGRPALRIDLRQLGEPARGIQLREFHHRPVPSPTAPVRVCWCPRLAYGLHPLRPEAAMFDAVMKNSVVPLLLRLCLATVFIYHGLAMVQKDVGTNWAEPKPDKE